MRFRIGIACLLALSGCNKSPYIDYVEKIERPAAGMAMLNVYIRARAPRQLEIWDGEKLLSLAGGAMLEQLQLDPGEHLLVVNARGKTGGLLLSAKAGKLYEMLVSPGVSLELLPMLPGGKLPWSQTGIREFCQTVRSKPDQIQRVETESRRKFARQRGLAYSKGGAWNWQLKKMGDEAAQ